MLTFSTLQTNRGLLAIANVSGTSTAFADLVNDAVRELLGIPDGFWNTIVKARMLAYSNYITWPSWVGSVKAINICNHPVESWNRWYSFVPLDSADYHTTCCWDSGVRVETEGTIPVIQNVPCGSENYLQVYRRVAGDDGKTMTVWGVDDDGQACTETITFAAGAGNSVTLADGTTTTGWIRSANIYRRVDRIHKDITTDVIDVYQYNPTANTLLDMAHYLPSETDPEYEHSRILGGCACVATGYSICLTILAKQRHVPVVTGTDIVQIDNIEAIKHMVQALKLGEATNPQGYAVEKAMAVKILNQQIADKMPDNATPIRLDPFGSAVPRRHRIGRIT